MLTKQELESKLTEAAVSTKKVNDIAAAMANARLAEGNEPAQRNTTASPSPNLSGTQNKG